MIVIALFVDLHACPYTNTAMVTMHCLTSTSQLTGEQNFGLYDNFVMDIIGHFCTYKVSPDRLQNSGSIDCTLLLLLLYRLVTLKPRGLRRGKGGVAKWSPCWVPYSSSEYHMTKDKIGFSEMTWLPRYVIQVFKNTRELFICVNWIWADSENHHELARRL